MLRKIRITLATISIIAITLLFLDFTGTIHTYLGWMAKIQFLPALLALNAVVIVSLLITTFIFGRIYCSVICPLGVFQDIIAWFSKRKKKLPYNYSKAEKWLRWTMLGVLIISFIVEVNFIVALLDPYASYGRMANNLFQPIYLWGNNLLADIAEHYDSYMFYDKEVWLKSVSLLIVSLITLIIIAILAWKNGRTYCNTICPVGTILGIISKYSIFKPFIDTSKCNSCGLCARKCKSACIDSKNHEIDYSRCVACMDCINNCHQKAISFTRRKKTQQENKKATDTSRRNFIMATATVAGTGILQAQEKAVDGGLATIEDKKIPNRTTPLVPAGALSLNNFTQHCTACQLCVSNCPNQVLRPSDELSRFMQPEMSYERGYCRPECTRCSEVCPTGAITPITKVEKSSIQIGHAVWIKDNCIVLTDDVACGNCVRHCPTGAITMIEMDNNGKTKKIPMIDTEMCIGCGACENLCPARPFSAIVVEGHKQHREI